MVSSWVPSRCPPALAKSSQNTLKKRLLSVRSSGCSRRTARGQSYQGGGRLQGVSDLPFLASSDSLGLPGPHGLSCSSNQPCRFPLWGAFAWASGRAGGGCFWLNPTTDVRDG